MQDLTYLAVEKYDTNSKSWITILRDNDWETEFEWIRTNTILGKIIQTFSKILRYRTSCI